jgi:hypothetical protein
MLSMRTLITAAAIALSPCTALLAQPGAQPPLPVVLDRVAKYVEGYGEQASAIVALEKYTQSVVVEGRLPIKPRKLTAEFAIVKVPGGGWTGYRDVFEVDGERLHDRDDRLASLARASADGAQFSRIAEESARFNIGPISRNFNVPTAALFFFQSRYLDRFSFSLEGRQTIDGLATWEIEFKENATPTFVTTRSGRNVPAEGTLWVIPENGVVVRTRLRLRNFLETLTSDISTRPAQRPSTLDVREIDSEADVDVTYRWHDAFGIWLPAKMSEFYHGPLVFGPSTAPAPARASTLASYSDHKRFTTSATIR